ncbi:hypothetical protein CPB84DRAFT_1850068 [Gymnopilus junonius]|uniref:ubiquitinyl hydrolase 1 n=1 Tax=Gymnopilus junonius TaxID=109634 RepID=A0A9P5NHD2_GYMJU|nr:hypothetical protein CPB84DRAFT_1850068 [Gymnopilus junonius]
MRLLQLFLDYDLPSELLYVTRIKTSRRIFKLGRQLLPPEFMKDLSEDIQTCLQKRWTKLQEEQARSPHYIPEPSSFKDHTSLSLYKSRSYLTKVMEPKFHTHVTTEFRPSHQPRLRDIDDFHKLCPDALKKAVIADPHLALADFELLVQDHLDEWVLSNVHNESACQTLDSCLEQYIAATKTHYSSSPEDESLMLLTIMELWVALDTIAVGQCPLLSSYSPEIPVSFLDPLLLRKQKSIERATRIQVYLRDRHAQATYTTSIYSGQLNETAFSIQYFRSSPELKELKTSIELTATKKKEQKYLELEELNAEHAILKEEVESVECSYTIYGEHKGKNKCYKCKLEKKIASMRIEVHEWPLPESRLEAEAVLFQLNCPAVFSRWRARTYHILRDIGMSHIMVRSGFTPHQLLGEYSALVSWYGPQGRITFASEAKSFLQAHYRDIKIPARKDQVCVKNGLHFQLYDSVKRELVHSTFNVDLEQYCTLRLPGNSESYRDLQNAITRMTVPHNVTIVNQGDCAPNLSIHEQLAFSNVRCGSQLQWMNIARELRANILTFSREEVHTLIMQAAWQIGPLADDTREWHIELEVPQFGRLLIQESMGLLSHVEANWTESTTIKSIIYLTSRLLTSTRDQQVKDLAFALLRKARRVTYKWMCEIVIKLQDAIGDDQADVLQRLACEMAALCRATFDVNPGDLDGLLCCEDDVAILIESSVIVHDNTPPRLGDKLPDLQRLLHRDRRLSHSLETPIKMLINTTIFKHGMDIAIERLWPGYRSGFGWSPLGEHNSRWLTSSTTPLGSQRAQQVHYNILDGTLLVDGRQLGRLASDIIEHPSYKRIFSQKILDVIPADMPGMEYATRSAVYDHEIFFAWQGSSLIIRVKTPSGRELEFIPDHILREDFPRLFSTEYIHWMDVNSGVIEFRPLDEMWKESGRNSRLLFSKNGPSRLMLDESGKRLLVDIRSLTFIGIASRLSPLESSEYLTVSHDSEIQPGEISINLPRFRLSFSLSDGEIESKNLHGMVIDSNQCTGTMVGLRNQLVLCHKDSISASLPRSRCVIIPFGDVRYTLSPDKNHVCVKIDTVTHFRRQVHWYRYEIDSDLGLLVGNVNLSSRLYRIYLHALCSHPLPDPLTQQKGTDHALQELSAAASFSFQRAADADLELLRLIGKITPQRRYYPKHLQSMQTTEWSPNLPALSQHNAFNVTVSRILHHAQLLTLFTNEEVDVDTSHGHQTFLTARAAQRSSVYYEGHFQRPTDTGYRSRDLPPTGNSEAYGIEALKASRLVYAWPGGLTHRINSSELLNIFKRWSKMSGPTTYLSLNYTKEWLGLNLSANWLGIYGLCRQGMARKFELIFSFAALAYSTPDSQRYIELLLAFATSPNAHFIPPPTHPFYDLSDGFDPLWDKVSRIVLLRRYDIMASPSGQLSQITNESNENFRRRRNNHYNDATEKILDNSVDHLMSQFKTEQIMDEIGEYFTSCSHNQDLMVFANQVTETLLSSVVKVRLLSPKATGLSFLQEFKSLDGTSEFAPSVEGIFSIRRAPLAASSSQVFEGGGPSILKEFASSLETHSVEKLISQFRQNCTSDFAQAYSERLQESRRQLDGRKIIDVPQTIPSMSLCLQYRDQCQQSLDTFFASICSAMFPSSITEEILMLAEYQNASFNWSDARKNPDWLLIQIQGNFITRAIQSEIAHEMIAPLSGENTVLQLNMGEGKSHVIVPLVTVALANSKKLVRVVVSKPLSGQMFHLLTERISGLTNRRVFYLPFSRDVKMNAENVQSIRMLFEECARVQGVLVAQPEHILSFRLMVIDRLLTSFPLDQSVEDLQKIQKWLTSTSCDILDESDELLHVRYQLIYTMGEQQPFDGSPDRWTITQKVLDLVRLHITELNTVEPFSEGVELLYGKSLDGEFPHMRLLGNHTSDELISRIAEDGLNGKLDTLTFVGLNPGSLLRDAVRSFITERNLSNETYLIVDHAFRSSVQWKGLLLLRGLLAYDILTYVLSRLRWRVEYGLDLRRSLLAVPFRAKDMPSLRSEFGHPDVVICLTCLSYYYTGLTSLQVQECFDRLAKLDNPPLEYERWVRRGGNDIPEALRQLKGVNTEDKTAFTMDVIPKFQHNQATIDFFLSQVVFPKEAKEFTSKLGASGWDLAEKKANPTTGFSGTNDNSGLLPTSINPTDTVKQLATNAQVLEYLLRAENERYICTQSNNGQPCSVTEFIELLTQEPREVRVLLDVGAQMLEMTNQQLVTHWLGLTKDEVAAGVFFDDADQLSVISKDGVVEPLYSSPFYQRLNECIVYLDDAHTRGTDLKLPLRYRAVVTLGPKITKDRLVQGCMRMRKLGHGQSILFCAPPEVDKRIRDTQKLAESEEVKVMDVLSWVMSRTCDDIEDHVPHWLQQGVDYHNRKSINFTAASSKGDIRRLKNAWLQPAAQSLDDMYCPSDDGSSSLNAARSIPEMYSRLKDLGATVIRDARMEEEQEREVNHELEQEQQIERPAKVKPAVHRLDEEVRSFVKDGLIPTSPGILLPMMTSLSTPSQKLRPSNPWSEELLSTRDFTITTQNGKEKYMLTDYLRPVQWILSHTRRDGRMILIVMSPYEVNALLKDIRNSKHPLSAQHLGGQLYLDKYETYLRLCLLLGISSSELEGYTSVENDRFVLEAGRVGDMKDVCLFDKSPIALLKTLFGLRRKGISFDLTHMGKILNARLVLPEDFEE